jgi:hypothetical protein
VTRAPDPRRWLRRRGHAPADEPLDQIEERVVWVLGSPRSGTTWLLGLLARLTDGTRIDEPLIGAHLALPLSAVSGFSTGAEDTLVLDAGAERPGYVFAEDAADVWLPDLRRLVLRRFDAERRRRGRDATSLLLVKEPNGSLAAPLLLRALPRSRVLFLVRDGRDVVDSELDAASGGWFADRYGVEVPPARRREYLEERARHWVATMAAVQHAMTSHPADLRHELTYEALLADTEGHLARIVSWLGRPSDPSVVRDAVERLSFDNVAPEARGPGRFARAASPGLWRERFDADEQRVLDEVMGPTLDALGYPRG